MSLVQRIVTVVAALGALTLAAGASANDDAHKPALDGYCPVAYRFNKAVKGKPEFSSEYQGRTYLFPTGEAKQMFDVAPSHFTVAYDGWSATAVAQGKRIAADPTVFELFRDRTYRFANQAAKDAFDQNRDDWITRADARWPALAARQGR